jgi:hypothetical protein
MYIKWMWRRQIAAFFARLRENPVLHWCVLFLVLAVTVDNRVNNANPYARYATLQAIAEDHTLAIDAYRDTTCDWARPPDGHYFSNKAPGPTLMAVPFHLPVDAMVVAHAKDRKERDVRRKEARDAVLSYLAIALQALPFALVVLLAADALAKRGASRGAIELAALAMLFGNTASLLMNMFFGHGMAALFTLAMALALLERRLFLAGLLFGLNVLTDYGSAMFFPVLVLMLALSGPPGFKTRLRQLARFGLGGLGPLIVFGAYHAYCFGGPFTLPNKYQNPVFVEHGRRALWGVIDLFPSWPIAKALLFGMGRGLWITQPWVLVVLAVCLALVWARRLWADRLPAVRVVLPLMLGAFGLLFFMNASFGGWHGGVCPGPRYLSAVFPLCGFALGLTYDRLPKGLRILLWLTVLPSVVLFILIWAGDPAIWPQHEIWVRCKETFKKFGLVSSYLRLTWIVFSFLVTTGIALLRRGQRSAGA